MEATSKSYVVRRVQEFPLSLDLTKDRKIEIIDTLRTLFSHYDLERTHFVFGLPQKYVSARLLNFPFRERFKVQKAIVSQLEDELPFSQEDAVFDVKIVRYLGKGADVLAMAVPKERIGELIDLAHDCGVEPTVVSTESLGLSNLFERWDQPPPESLAVTQEIPAPRQAELVVNIGHMSTDLLVYSDGLLLGVRHIDWGARNLADAIGQKYGLNYLQGIRELQTKGFILLDKASGTREQTAFSQVIEASLQTLVSDMRLKMLELQSEMNLQWSKASLVGGGAQLKNLGAFLTQQFQIPFNRFKQFDHQAVTFDSSPHLEIVSGVAVGLAIEGLRRPRNPATNFMKDEFAQQSRVLEAVWEKWGYTAKLVGSAFVILLVYSVVRESMSFTLLEQSDEVMRKQAQDIAGIKRTQASPDRIGRFIKNQENLERARKQAAKVEKINSPLDLLERMSSALAPRERIAMEIKRITVDNDSAEVHGYTGNANERDQVMAVMRRLASDGKADNIPIRIPVPAGKIGFAYKFQINRFAGG
ncbi:MAG: pilus assembly protein PilM [Bdellovibrionales bacterium]|nr:pilus assembly protein PilM [Bdellovibrionales bacterium]